MEHQRDGKEIKTNMALEKYNKTHHKCNNNKSVKIISKRINKKNKKITIIIKK